MKKCVSVILALVMALALCSVSWADGGDGTASNPYSLDEFNKLTAIPEGMKEVYVNIGDVSLKNGSVTVGNDSICDVYTTVTGDYTVGQKLEDGRVIAKVWNADKKVCLANSNKAGITLYVSGSVKENNDYGLNNEGAGPFPNSLSFKIPDASSIVFTKDFTVNGYFRMSPSFNDNKNLGGGVAAHKVKSVLFDHSTFNGIWIQNGGFFADSITLDGCTFNAYENKNSANDSNPLWFCNIRDCDITVKNCNFTATRPIKIGEQQVDGATVKITGNTFNLSAQQADTEQKHVAVMFSRTTNTSAFGDVEVSDNKVNGGVALLTFYQDSKIQMADGATFTVEDNELGNGVKTSVVWKSTEEFKPEFVKVTEPTPEKPSNNYYYYSPSTTTTDTTKGSPKTFDAGVALYVGMALTSAAGLAYTGKKRED